jgi:hypothetical protein
MLAGTLAQSLVASLGEMWQVTTAGLTVKDRIDERGVKATK